MQDLKNPNLNNSQSSINLNLYSKDYLTFWYFWISRIFMVSGFQILCLVLAWQMYMLTNSAFDLGLVGLLQFIPRVFLVLIAGLVVDRFDRRKIVAITLALQGLISLIMILASMEYIQNTRGLIFLVSFLIGVCRTFDMPAMQSLLPEIVPKQILSKAIAASTSATQIATISSPAIGGLLYGFGAGLSYTLTCIAYIIGVFCILKVPKVQVIKHSSMNLKSMLMGIDYILKRKDILGAISLDLFAVLLGGATALLPVFAHDILHTSAFGLGVLRSAPAVGALIMSTYLVKYPLRNSVGKKMFLAVFVFGLSTITFGLSSSYTISFLSLVVLGASDVISVIIRTSFIQLHTPDEMRGRVNAVNSLFIGASNQLGEFESGITASWWGSRIAVVVGGCATFAVAILWMKWFPSLRDRDTLE